MTLFSIHAAEAPADDLPVAVADRFSWFAALLPPVYLLAHRAWLGLLGFVVAVLAIVAIGMLAGEAAGLWLYVVLAAWCGFEGPGLRRRALGRRGLAYAGDRVATAADIAALQGLRLRGGGA